ncbi:MBL fold metallo-hydrolase [Rhodococcoides kyotonense]|uniref:Cyclase n=1 Tax=Rhodococcoides kyotonense TaxID=398843 RepID=A0A239M9U9_9NOCA|nr:MBL fold metallo-hydrolase [Rhodococcus kyotonensis]SNT39747.1 cyclase [Rhodococcus kyotonensis]
MNVPGVTEELVAKDAYAFVQQPGGWCVSNAGLVVGDEQALIIDTAATEARARAWRAAVDERTGNHARSVISTHHHGDHTFGNHLFADTSTIVSHVNGASELRRKGLAMTSVWPGVDWGDVEATIPDTTIATDTEFDVGGRRVDVLALGVSHTSDDLAVFDRGSGVLYVGDVAFSGSAPFVLGGSVEGSIETLTWLQSLKPRLVVCGHGPVRGVDVLEENVAYLRYIQFLAEEAVRGTLSPLAVVELHGLGQFGYLAESERVVANVHRGIVELNGAERGAHLDSAPIMREMVLFNGGRPLSCYA